MGGHSLNALTLINKVYKEFNVNIPLKEFFVRDTIRSMAEYILTVLWLNKKSETRNENKTVVTV
jgi:fengycin family lipopeptide synthetase D